MMRDEIRSDRDRVEALDRLKVEYGVEGNGACLKQTSQERLLNAWSVPS